MSVPLLHRRSIHIASVVAVVVSVLAGAASTPALGAREQQPQRLAIVRPYHTNVSGTIFFAVRGIKPGAVRMVFSIDAHEMWSVRRVSPRLRRATAINTRKLRNGRHVLRLRVTYANHRTATVRKVIVVHNGGKSPAPVKAHPASANPPAVTALAPPAAGVEGPSVAEFNRTVYGWTSNLPNSVEANRYQFIVLQGSDYAEIPILKAINPNLKFLVYQAIMYTARDDYSWMPTDTGCTTYADDLANHPSWFLRDPSGDAVLEPGRTDIYATDVGNPGYQQACAANAVAMAKQHGFDGIFWDTADGNLTNELQGASIPEYSTQASWDTAMGSALAYVGAAMHAQGLLSVANIGGTDQATWEQWTGSQDGVEEESWTDGGEGLAQQIPFWSQKLTELSWAMANHKYEIVHSFNGGEAANTFGLAAMLLAANGYASYSVSNTSDGPDETWFPEYDTAQQLGAPAGAYTVLANGVYERAFDKGIVLVNPTGNSIPAFSLGGGSYSGTGLTNVQSVALGPTSAAILLKTG